VRETAQGEESSYSSKVADNRLQSTNREIIMATVKKFTVTPLKFDAKLVEQVTRRRTNGESISTIAKALKLTAGKVAMAELVGTTERVTHDDPAKLARAIAKDRKAGKSWGYLAARYGVTEGTCRAAYEAATGKPHSSLDYRKAKAVVAAVLALLLLPAMASARPGLSLAKADQAASTAVVAHASAWNAELAEILASDEVNPAQDTSAVVTHTVYPCDRETAFRALCDYTYDWSDGTSCDYTLEIVESNPSGRHERLAVRWPSDEDKGCYPTAGA
jgi:hypothetical protein